MRVLIAYDGSAHAKAAIDDLDGAGLPRQTEVIVTSIAHRSPNEKAEEKSASPWKATMEQAEALADEGKSRVQSLFPSWSVSCVPFWGDPAATLLKTLKILKPDLAVVGSHGRSIPTRRIMGSVAAELVYFAPCSVRVVRHPPRAQKPARILVAADGSKQAQACVDAVARRSWPEGTRARILAVKQTLVSAFAVPAPAPEDQTFATLRAAVIEESNARERVKLRWVVNSCADRLQRAGLLADFLVVDGDPRYEISGEAERWRADMVFIGARRLDALDRLLLGSVTTAVVHHTSCAVEVDRRT